MSPSRPTRARVAGVLLVAGLGLSACTSPGTPPEPSPTATDPVPTPAPTTPPNSNGPLPNGLAVPAVGETDEFADGSGDIADDPAIWVDPTDGSRSVVLGTSKDDSDGGLAVYDLTGAEIQFLPVGKLNNVDLRTGVLGDLVLAVASNRTDDSLHFFVLDPDTRRVREAGSTSLGFEPYGTCLYVSPETGDVYAFVTENADSSAAFEQYRLSASGATVRGTRVRALETETLSEGCVAHDAGQVVFLGEEDVGLFRYDAEPTADGMRTTIDLVGGNLRADVEGVDIAEDPAGGPAYLVVSSQGDDTFQIYDLEAPHRHRGWFTVGGEPSIRSVTGTDGLAVTREDLGPLFPHGLLVVHDADPGDADATTYAFVNAAEVFGPVEGR